jgi:hypothetical protein
MQIRRVRPCSPLHNNFHSTFFLCVLILFYKLFTAPPDNATKFVCPADYLLRRFGGLNRAEYITVDDQIRPVWPTLKKILMSARLRSAFTRLLRNTSRTRDKMQIHEFLSSDFFLKYGCALAIHLHTASFRSCRYGCTQWRINT